MAGVDVDAEIRGAGLSRHWIQSGSNRLDAVWCVPAQGEVRHAVMICHGIGETVAYWSRVQRLLADDGVASLVFDYSGYGRSSGWISARQCEGDAEAAFQWMRSQVSVECSATLIGFSMGTGVTGAVANRVWADRLVMAAGFTSFREAAVSIGWPRWLIWMSPDIWDNCVALCAATMPVLVVHGENDQLFPCEMAHAMAGVCVTPCETLIVPGLSHAAPIFRAGPEYWHAISGWLKNAS